MLAQNFMTPTALGITEVQQEALIKTLRMLESGKLDDKFDMHLWSDEDEDKDCQTACCIGGWARRFGAEFLAVDTALYPYSPPKNRTTLNKLFCPFEVFGAFQTKNPQKGAYALRNFLTTGNPHWEEVMK